jgi:xylulokinase
MTVLGIDVGTTTCKGIVINEKGEILAQAYDNYLQKPVISGDRAELPAEVFKDGVFAVIKELASKVKDIDPVRAIAFSTHGETLIPVDKTGKALYPAILSMDRRCKKQKERIGEIIGEERFYEICGTPLHTQYPMPKIMWLKENEPQIAENTAIYCTAQDYLHLCLGVAPVVDYSLASRFGGFDIRKKKWSDEILKVVGVDKSKFSSPAVSGTNIGVIPDNIASELSLEKGVAVVLGGHDQPCASLGMGASDNKATVSAGSYECISIATDEPLNGKDGYRYGLNSYCHALDGKYITLAFFASGLMISWFFDKFCGKDCTFESLEKLVKSGPTGVCFTPHAYGSMNPKWDDTATAKIVGVRAETGLGDLYKALLEGASCELDLNIRALEKLSGESKRLTFCGGGTKSELWMQLRADILGRDIQRLEGNLDCSCIGAGILAGLGVGMFKTPQEAIDRLNYQKTVFTPKNAENYEKQKQNYLLLTGVSI